MALLCACKDGKRCAECERIERFDAFRRNMVADLDRMAAEADEQSRAAWLRLKAVWEKAGER